MFALLPSAGPAGAAITNIAQLPLLNISGSGVVKPNLMLLFDNSGSMGSTFTPDYVDDSVTCRARFDDRCHPLLTHWPPTLQQPRFQQAVLQSGGAVRAARQGRCELLSDPEQGIDHWLDRVTPDAFGVNDTNFLGVGKSSSDLVTKFSDLKWCDTSGNNCAFNSATYAYPDDVRIPRSFLRPTRITMRPGWANTAAAMAGR